jgi:hypothetical protein
LKVFRISQNYYYIPFNTESSDSVYANDDADELSENEKATAVLVKRPTLEKRVRDEHGNAKRVRDVGKG